MYRNEIPIYSFGYEVVGIQNSEIKVHFCKYNSA